MGSNDTGMGLFSARLAAKVARIRYQNFQAWAKASLLHGRKITIGRRVETTYSYRDLLLIRLIVRLKAQGSRPKAIKVALDTIELMSGGERDAWMKSTMLVSSGIVVVFLPDKPQWNPVAASKGPQKMAVVFFPDLIKELQDELVPPDKFPYIEINPEVLGGAPVVKGTRITIMAIASTKESGQDAREAYPRLTKEQVENAEAYEEFLRVA